MSMDVEVSVDIAASPQQIWAVMFAVERWPEWTPSISSLERLDQGEFRVGSRARIRQPKLPTMIWEVTQLEPGRGFVWKTRAWGAVTSAAHWISADGNGSKVVLKVHQTGLLEPIFRPWISKLTRRNVDMEAQCLKKRCEAGRP